MRRFAMGSAEADLIGEIVDGRFRVEARLGGGGMGTVWRVQHAVSLQRFALKTLDPSHAAHPEATRRFVREARAAAALRTRHVVKIVDAQMDYTHNEQPLPFLVMELLEGETLLEVLDRRGRLQAGELGWLAGMLGRALEAAHRHGIVHRDLKPSNVFIAEDDEGQPTIKLCDFGIAKLIDRPGEGSLETYTGAVLGTPMYLAPELLRGAGDAVLATDQWALGLLAFRALAGMEYFGHARGFAGLVLAIASDPMLAPSARAPSLPAAFDAWFLRSCAREPALRFPDVAAQVAALAAALGNPVALPIAPRAAARRAGAAEPEAAAERMASPPPPAAAPAGQPLHAERLPVPRRARARLFLVTSVVWAVAALAAASWIEGRSRARPVLAAPPPPGLAASPAVPGPSALPPQTAPATGSPPGADAPSTPIAETPVAVVKEKRAHRPHDGAHIRVAAALRPEATARTEAPARTEVPHAAAPVAAAPPARAAAAPPVHPPAEATVRGKAKGASCQRSAECASGLCAAETCL